MPCLLSFYQLPQPNAPLCSSFTSSPNDQTHGKPTTKHQKTPYPPYPQTNRYLIPQNKGRSPFSVRENFSVYFTIRTYFIYLFILNCHFSKAPTLIHLFYNLFYLNNNIFIIILYFSFVSISLSLSLSLSLSDQSVVPHLLIFLLLPFTVTVRSPPFHKHFLLLLLLLLLLFLTVRSAFNHKHHKNQNP